MPVKPVAALAKKQRLVPIFLTGFADLIISDLTQSRTDSLMRLPNGQLLFAVTISLSLRHGCHGCD
jgi:hypothetical protein